MGQGFQQPAVPSLAGAPPWGLAATRGDCRPHGPLCSSLSERTGKILTEFLRFYEDQYGVALFNSMRHEIEGTGLPQAQLLWRKVSGAELGMGRAPTRPGRVAS